MSSTQPTKNWNPAHIDRLIDLFDRLEASGIEPVRWTEPKREVIDGEEHLQIGYPNYAPELMEFWDLCYKTSCYIDPYAVLPEDPPGTEAGMDTLDVIRTHEAMATATLNQVRRYFILCTRGERFCDGYIAGELESGVMWAAVRRLKELREAR